ncbi:Centromere protein Cenp-I [Penicillium chermesinum]|nr:Centromere protein Cenp-I [Penicillium chermesinum]
MSHSPESPEHGQHGRLAETVEHLEAVAFVPVKQRYTDANQLAQTIASAAYENGIPADILRRLLKILTKKNNLDQGTVTTLIKNLYPQELIASNHVTQVVCCLGPSKAKASPATQSLLVRWLILTYDLLEDKSHLGKLYAVLFNHLDMISLRKPLCHLLSLITRRKHNYYPEIILGGGTRRALFFKHADPEWSSHAKVLLAQNTERSEAAASSIQSLQRGLAKRTKIEVVIPVLQTSRVSNKHTSLEELRSIEHFVDKIDRIELPNQIISTLGDVMARKYIHLIQSEAANHRLDEWLGNFLQDKLEQIQGDDDDDPEILDYVLDVIVGYSAYTKHLLPSVRSFLLSFLQLWNGKEHREQVFRLLQYLPVEPFEALQSEVLSPLENAALDGTLRSRMDLLGFYSALIAEWGVKLRVQPSATEESIPLSRLIRHAELLASAINEFELPDGNISGVSIPADLSILKFYQSLARLFSHAPHHAHIRLSIPPAPLMYSLSFTPTVSVISTLSSILTAYKSGFEASITSHAAKSPNTKPLYDPKSVNHFNGYVMDTCNMLWRNRGLNTDDPNARACLVPKSTIAALQNYVRNVDEAAKRYDRESAFHCTLATIFSLSHNAAYSNLSAACFRDLEADQQIAEHRPQLRKPVTAKALQALEKEGGAKITWQEYKVHMLDWLDAIGSRGTSDLMRSTLKVLRKE